MQTLTPYFNTVGRVMISAIFLLSGISKVTAYAATQGYMAAMGIMKHPDVYTASVNRSGVTDWRNYDTIYTERYMSTPQLNPEGYKNGSVMTYVDQFEGQILILHGMIDDNVHPNNAFQLIDAMDKADKRYESRFWPNSGHGVPGTQSMWEFFDRILQPNTDGR